MNIGQQQKLVEALLKCACMKDRQACDAIVLQLPFGDNITRSNVDKLDVRNMVTAILNYPHGFDKLVSAVQFFEGDSIPLRAFKGSCFRGEVK